MVKIRDIENFNVYKKIYNIDFGKDKTPFDLIIDTNSKRPEEVAEIILNEYKKRNNR